MASRLKLLGLLLICTSVLVFLVLSACGVDSVHVNTPLAKRLATRWQLTSAPTEPLAAAPPRAADSLLTAAPALASQPQYAAAPTGGLQVLPPGYAAGQYSPPAQPAAGQYTAGQYTAGQYTDGRYTDGRYTDGRYTAAEQSAGMGGGSTFASPATPVPLFASTDFDRAASGAATAVGGETVASAAEVSLRIPLWCINAVFLAIGFVLWSMPQPRPSVYSGGRRP